MNFFHPFCKRLSKAHSPIVFLYVIMKTVINFLIQGGFTMQIALQSNGYEVIINTMGAELKSFKNPSQKEYVWNSDPAYWMRSSPLLFPTIGNLRDGKTTMKGQVYPLVKHGFCKDSEFEVTNQTKDTVTFLLRANEETLKAIPICLSFLSPIT